MDQTEFPTGLILKEFALELAPCLTILIQASLYQGIVPNDWKKAFIHTSHFKEGTVFHLHKTVHRKGNLYTAMKWVEDWQMSFNPKITKLQILSSSYFFTKYSMQFSC